MRTSKIRQVLGLKRFLSGPLGTMYYIPYAPGQEQVNVRHFDGALPPRFVNAYADLIGAVQRLPGLGGGSAGWLRLQQHCVIAP